MLKSRFLLLFLLITNFVFGQNTFMLSGTVRDDTGVLPGAGVFISGYKIATATDNNGKFNLPNLLPGSYYIVIQMMGYHPLSKKISITNQSLVIDLKLNENAKLLKEVVIKHNPNRAEHIALFKEFFLGNTPNTAQCNLLNTDMLLIDDDVEQRTLSIKASDFLIIENLALGYRIKYMLEEFKYNFEKKILFFAGHPIFEEMKGSNSEQKKWLKNREIAYKGSAQHFFNALYHHKIDEEGFVLYKRYEEPNPKKLPENLIKANIARIMTGKTDPTIATPDSLRHLTMNDWQKRLKEPKMLSFIYRKEVEVDTLVKNSSPNLKTINFKDELFVIYKNENEPLNFDRTYYYQNRAEDLKNYQITAIKMITPISFYANGMVVNPGSTLYSGFWSYEKMADAVPIDYISTIK